MRSLTLREYILIGIMLFLLAMTGAWIGVQRFGLLSTGVLAEQLNKKDNLNATLLLRKQQLARLNKLEKDWLNINRFQETPIISSSLNALVERKASSLKLRNSLQLNPLNSVPEGMEGVQVKMDRLNLDQMFDMLFALEHNKPVVLLEQLEITTIPGSELIRINFRLYKQKKR